MEILDYSLNILAGTWRLLLSTGKDTDMGCLDTVLLYAYGHKGCCGPITIGHGKNGVFLPGTTDEFKVCSFNLVSKK